MQISFSLLLVLAAAICSHTEAWVTTATATHYYKYTHQQTAGRSLLKCQLSACSPPDEEENRSSRRRFFLTGVGSISAFLLTDFPAMAADDSSSNNDPFAQMDAFAAGMGSSSSASSNDPNLGSPLLSTSTNKELTTTAEPLPPKAPASDMQKALGEAKRRRKVEPLTHG
jgi:hypothetical protein